MSHFSTCPEYETKEENNWEDIYINNPVRQKEIGLTIQSRIKTRRGRPR